MEATTQDPKQGSHDLETPPSPTRPGWIQRALTGTPATLLAAHVLHTLASAFFALPHLDELGSPVVLFILSGAACYITMSHAFDRLEALPVWQGLILPALSAVRTFFKFSSEDSDFLTPGWSNPVHIAVAREGYRIQSQVLGLSDRFGFLDNPSGNPSTGVDGGFIAVFVAFGIACFLVCYTQVIPSFRSKGIPVLPIILFLTGMQIMGVALIWAAKIQNRISKESVSPPGKVPLE